LRNFLVLVIIATFLLLAFSSLSLDHALRFFKGLKKKRNLNKKQSTGSKKGRFGGKDTSASWSTGDQDEGGDEQE